MEREEVETMGSLNKVLLENILPAHVAEHYLYSPHRSEVSYNRLRILIGVFSWLVTSTGLRNFCPLIELIVNKVYAIFIT